MPLPAEALTVPALSSAMDAAALRHQAIAANIAHHDTPGYVPVKLDFAAALEAQRRQAAGLSAPAPQPRLDAQGRPMAVRLDAELADMAQNALHYQAMARALSRHMAILHTAASDGKR